MIRMPRGNAMLFDPARRNPASSTLNMQPAPVPPKKAA